MIVPCDFASVSLERIVCTRGIIDELARPRSTQAGINQNSERMPKIQMKATPRIASALEVAIFAPNFLLSLGTKNICPIKPTTPNMVNTQEIFFGVRPKTFTENGWNA